MHRDELKTEKRKKIIGGMVFMKVAQGEIQSIPGQNGHRAKRLGRMCNYEYEGLLGLVVGK